MQRSHARSLERGTRNLWRLEHETPPATHAARAIRRIVKHLRTKKRRNWRGEDFPAI